ncbi:MAG: restriction endonuclease [Patescibacteria group bacterium]|nr:restriction endonuclease [Patescibacteria group bacterium]MDD5121144.1 restriction endonuclease [Patescibacteria group bacterium]MDD5221659.1 restriction endonuclease [Patescibacteria group bacterium]MDD5395937.1 restriction endonuclease [Patescibacteria group bacterium]
MKRSYKDRYNDGNDFANLVTGIIVFYLLYLVLLWFTNKANFWRWLLYGFGVVALSFIGVLVWRRMKEKRRLAKRDWTVNTISQAGLEESINNFIVRFGLGERSKNAWRRRNYNIDWYRIHDLQEDLAKQNIKFTLTDMSILLSHYINKREHDVTTKSINASTINSFTKLSSSDFERLLDRLYRVMGYSVQLNGRTGDQGGDLIATKGQERILIQAKCYINSTVGNSAVQQVVAARNHYDCNRAAVVTSGYFTKEAVELAKTNNVELIPREILQKMLLDYLHESWN